MTAALATPSRTYGAQELKQSYQRGLTLALVVAVAAHLAVIAGARWFASGAPASPPPVSFDEIFRRAPFEPTPPIRIEAEPGAIPGAPPKIDALKGIPRLVPDIDVTRTVLIPTRYEDSVLEYWDQYPTDSGTGAGPDPGNLRGIRGIRSVDVVIPKETVWVPHQEEPRRIGGSHPVYPAIPKISGTEAVVRVRMFVDAYGVVHEPYILSCTAKGLGFEEAVLDAAVQWKFKPAQQNGNAVGIWYNVRVAFRLD